MHAQIDVLVGVICERMGNRMGLEMGNQVKNEMGREVSCKTTCGKELFIRVDALRKV